VKHSSSAQSCAIADRRPAHRSPRTRSRAAERRGLSPSIRHHRLSEIRNQVVRVVAIRPAHDVPGTDCMRSPEQRFAGPIGTALGSRPQISPASVLCINPDGPRVLAMRSAVASLNLRHVPAPSCPPATAAWENARLRRLSGSPVRSACIRTCPEYRTHCDTIRIVRVPRRWSRRDGQERRPRARRLGRAKVHSKGVLISSNPRQFIIGSKAKRSER
jgi:hypothetical protein